jgi:hypothetical protein
MYRKARLIKRTTDDGFFEVYEHIPLGKIYMVDIGTRRMAKGYNTVYHAYWTREIIDTFNGEWMPTEILEIE